MSPAPETVRQPSHFRSSEFVAGNRQTSEGQTRTDEVIWPPPLGDVRFSGGSGGVRRNFSGGPRPAPFSQRIHSSTGITGASTGITTSQGEDANSARAMLLSALETRRRRIEELRSQSNIATTIADQWRRQREEMASAGYRRTSSPAMMNRPDMSVAPRLSLEETSDSDSEDDNDDNKWGMNEVRRTPPPTFLTPNTSPSTSTEAPNQDDDSSRNAYTLSCRFCANVLTKRGMRARLVADKRVHIWSTDEQPRYPL
jgi:FAM72 protein